MEFSSETVAQGGLGFVNPIKVAFSNDDSRLTFLFPDETGQRQIYSVSASSAYLADDSTARLNSSKLFTSDDGSAGKISLEEQLRRERMRLFTAGISHYEWAKNQPTGKQVMVVPVGDKLYLFDDFAKSEETKHHVIYDSSIGAGLDPHLSPSGDSLAFIVNNNLYCKSIASGSEITQLTTEGGSEGISCAVADYIAQEEMSRYEGFWWAPNSQSILYTVNDESFIPKYDILHQGKSDPKHSETHRYPFAGKQNPLVKLFVLKVPSDSTQPVERKEIQLISDDDQRFASITPAPGKTLEYYVARAGWWPDGSIMVQITDRRQMYLQLLRFDPTTGERTVLLEERSDVWINLHDLLHCCTFGWQPAGRASSVAGDFYFLWGSERSGFMQLYFYRFNAAEGKVECLNSGNSVAGGEEWVVDSLDAVDEERGFVYYSGNYSHISEKHLLRGSLINAEDSASSLLRLTQVNGWHDCTVNAKTGVIADKWSNLTTPARFDVLVFDTTTGAILRSFNIYNSLVDDRRLLNNLPTLQAIATPTIHKIRSSDGAVDLYCAVYMPPGYSLQDYLDGATAGGNKRTFPAIMSVYGGPHVMRVLNQWMTSADMRAQRMAQQGIVVIKCDNRGSYRRGVAFEGALRYDMGNIEVQDQCTAVDYFAKIGLVDRSRVGMFGWSYGGYMSAMSLCRSPDVFCCAVAGAPVTSWDGYDTHYTERYMGHPEENVKGYADSSVMTSVKNMHGKLMLIHGLIDENVHFRHTARLINALIEQRKRYELILFPCERHAPHKMQDRIYLEDIMFDFFLENLKPSSEIHRTASFVIDGMPSAERPSASVAAAVEVKPRANL